MSDSRKNKNILIWSLVIIFSITLIVINAMFFNNAWWMWIPVSIIMFIGCTISFSQYFVEPERHCPKCNAEIQSAYAKHCPQCGLLLLTKCIDCGKYISVYQSGKPSKYCNQCGLELDLREQTIEIIENPYIHDEKIRFCPTCGVNVEEENVRYCALCGGKID